VALPSGRGDVEDIHHRRAERNNEVLTMDVWMVLGTAVFFLIAIGYTVACEKLK
jgi:hypothetical protein